MSSQYSSSDFLQKDKESIGTEPIFYETEDHPVKWQKPIKGTEDQNISEENGTLISDEFPNHNQEKEKGYDKPLIIPRNQRLSPANIPYTKITKNVWFGEVLCINDDYFRAELRDATNVDNPPEEADFYFDEIDESEHELIKLGSKFYFYIYQERKESSGIKTASEIKFRKMTRKWTERELANIDREADELVRYFKSR